ncbi:endonuclease domain-containing protein [Azospirillum doebereinerae]|uniref:Endonuclease domain-containing protein n=1 Tax=Azospirillum doebereinerae TaxID=92933 RepID=A0A433IZG7_9PROT|nr:endonuclease domain-containing protein [Azospirillum doebereinerae]MCG5242984.1 endonuclease domain-containing protein [Azospirillum doebereinerae]RUQ60438.1 endonuclease domain-containing protein [Azospirillum doebereinerae]
MTTQRSRTLRQTATEAEKLLWHGLRDRRLGGLKFRRQQTIERYVVDFLCFDKRLIIEVDGGQHNAQADGPRTAFLEAQGYRVLRFWNPEVLTNPSGVLETILAAAEGRLER